MIEAQRKLGAALLFLFPLGVACSSASSGGTGNPGTGGSGGDNGFQSGGGSSVQSGGTGNGGFGNGGDSQSGGSGGSQSLRIDGGSTPYPYDLNTQFTWPESNSGSGAGGLCKAGHYVGTYQCEVTNNDAGVYALQGPVDLRLAEAQNGEFLSVSGGTLASAAGILSLNASLVGKLSCQTGAFNGTLQNGTLAIPPFPPGGTFSGSLSAEFASGGPKLDGTWTLLGEGVFQGYVCHGPWTATWQAN